MRKYLLSGLKLMLVSEEKFGRFSLVAWPFLSLVLLAICVHVAQLLSYTYGFNPLLANALMFFMFSPAVVLFYASFMLVADELLSLVMGIAFYGKEPGSLRKRLRRMVGI